MKEINIYADYYDLLEEYILENPDKNELDFINNEIDFYKEFIEEFENGSLPFPGCKDKEAAIIDSKIYYNYFRDKLRTIQFQKNDFEKNVNINESLPYKIALLDKIDFFSLPTFKNITKVNQRKVLQKLIGGSDRQIKGNINVLNPKSTDDRIRYTSFMHEEEVLRFLQETLN